MAGHLLAEVLVENLAAAVLLINDRSKHLLYANATAERSFGIVAPFVSTAANTHLVSKLQASLPRLCEGAGTAFRTFGWRERGRTIFGLARPLERHTRDFVSREVEAVSMIFLHDPTMVPELHTQHLHSRYGLTPKEARLALGVAYGGTLNALSDDFGVSRQTLRSQMKSVLKKAQVPTQAQLTIKLLGDDALMFMAESL